MATLHRYRFIEGCQFTVISDHNEERCRQASDFLRSEKRPQPRILEWKQACCDEEVDLVYICTNWDSHAEIALHAMRQGKHVAVEVPAATTLQECEELLQVAKETGKHCMMLENCCYDTFHLGVLGLVRQGLLGEITHCEGAYIHYLAEDAAIGYTGNPYPTHALGPICQLLKGDSLESLVSMNGQNHINSTLLRTTKGRTILLQFDETTPRPYSRLQVTCGTKGFVQKYPTPCVQLGEKVWSGDEAEHFIHQHIAPDFQALIEDGKRLGVPNLMNYIMDRRLMEALHQGTALDISPEESVLWSSIVELTARSASQGGAPIAIPTSYRRPSLVV